MREESNGETEPLIRDPDGNAKYGSDVVAGDRPFLSNSTPSTDNFDSDDESGDDDDEAEIKKRREERLKETGGWIGYLKDFGIFVPYLVPRKDVKVQFCLVVCLMCLAGTRVLHILVPHQLGVIADKFLASKPPYRDLLLWLGLSVLNSSSGLDMIRELAVIPVRQFSDRQITNTAFRHVLSLSMDFHSERDSAEVMKALDQGSSLTKLLETAVCEFLPTIADLTVALAVLYWKFDIYTSLIVVTAFLLFIALQILTTRWKIEPRRRFAKAQRQEARVMHQAIQGWTTISYFNMFGFERRRFGKTLEGRLTAERRWSVLESFTQGAVEIMIPLTFFALTCKVVYSISRGQSKGGDFVFLIQYWEGLIWPLRWLSHDYREIMSNLIDAERLLALLQTKPSIIDREDAKEIGNVDGHVAFEGVSFAYDGRRTILSDIDISVKPGETVALVGATGAGKSTMIKLLLRFYDVTGGRITIDGHDIRDIKVDSLRSTIGVVPQDPDLFNDTILENLRYARPSATFPEIISACTAAAIHDRILSFPDGYKTRVGEQGVKLSGGEVQRLAIARAILKDPSILILDEATSAIDTHIESNIQRALDAFKHERKRTTFVIAHRLSTIVGSDQILVFDEGRIVERGRHAELIRREGVYKRLWSKQTGTGAQG